MARKANAIEIDPSRDDVCNKRRKPRKHRDRPDPPADLAARREDAERRVSKLPLSPGIMLEEEGGRTVPLPPHNDEDLWDLQLSECFGTRSWSLKVTFLERLRELVPQVWDQERGWQTNEIEWNAALAIVAGVKPRNAVEAMMAAQMVAVNMLTMKMAARALGNGHTVYPKEAAITARLAQAFAAQVETLHTIRGRKRGSQQTIRVKRESHHHQHIHIHREGAENGGHSDATGGTGLIENRASVPSANEGGEVVPLASRARKAGV